MIDKHGPTRHTTYTEPYITPQNGKLEEGRHHDAPRRKRRTREHALHADAEIYTPCSGVQICSSSTTNFWTTLVRITRSNDQDLGGKAYLAIRLSAFPSMVYISQSVTHVTDSFRSPPACNAATAPKHAPALNLPTFFPSHVHRQDERGVSQRARRQEPRYHRLIHTYTLAGPPTH